MYLPIYFIIKGYNAHNMHPKITKICRIIFKDILSIHTLCMYQKCAQKCAINNLRNTASKVKNILKWFIKEQKIYVTWNTRLFLSFCRFWRKIINIWSFLHKKGIYSFSTPVFLTVYEQNRLKSLLHTVRYLHTEWLIQTLHKKFWKIYW